MTIRKRFPIRRQLFFSDVKRKLKEKSLTQETMVMLASVYACYFNPTPLSISIRILVYYVEKFYYFETNVLLAQRISIETTVADWIIKCYWFL